MIGKNHLSNLPANLMSNPFFTSWSGGKDSCLALHRAVVAGGVQSCLFTMMGEDGTRSHSHGLPLSVLQAQAVALAIPLLTRAASWSTYEESFRGGLQEIKSKGINLGVFGDIDLQEHKEWVERVCNAESISAWEPLWLGDRQSLLTEFINLGYEAMVVAVKDGVLDPALLGRTLDKQLISEFTKAGIDASGECGEYHTVVVNGPMFSHRIPLFVRAQVVVEGYHYLDMDTSG